MLASGQQRFLLRFCAAFLGLGLLVSACGGGDDDDTAEEPGSPPPADAESASAQLPEGGSWVARANADLTEFPVYDSADATDPSSTLPNPDVNGTPAVFLVDGPDASGERIPVFLPIPPNGTKGWVDAADVEIFANPYRIRIELEAHRLTVTNADEVTVDTPVAVGDQGWETPTGTYFVKELLRPPDPSGDYGPYAYGISGFSTPDAAQAMGIDGPGVIGIHGTNQPELLGTNVSHGCIRVANDVITEMADYLPLGTPVEIVA